MYMTINSNKKEENLFYHHEAKFDPHALKWLFLILTNAVWIVEDEKTHLYVQHQCVCVRVCVV